MLTGRYGVAGWGGRKGDGPRLFPRRDSRRGLLTAWLFPGDKTIKEGFNMKIKKIIFYSYQVNFQEKYLYLQV